MDTLKRKYFLKNELKRMILRSAKNSNNLTYLKRYQSSYYLALLPRISSKVFITHRCAFSGRVWSVNRKTRYSRFLFRTESYDGNIPGCRRASW